MTDAQFAVLFSKYRREARACLYSDNGYAWQDRGRTLKMMVALLGEISPSLWPTCEDPVILQAGNWRLDLMRDEDGSRMANLHYLKDDHTAWVIEGGNGWADFDIGGS